MKKNRLTQISVFLFALVLIVFSNVIIGASGAYVDDGAGIIDDATESKILSKISSVSDKYNFDIVILSTSSFEGMTAQEFADEYYDYHGYSDDGILFLINPVDRKWAISTKGIGMTVFDSEVQSDIISDILDDMSNGNYTDAFYDFTKFACNKVINYNSVIPNLYETLIIIAVGIAIAVIIALVMRSKLITVVRQEQADNYIPEDGVRITLKNDVFITKNVIKEEIHSDNSDSDSHSSSSGSTHGGSSGSF